MGSADDIFSVRDERLLEKMKRTVTGDKEADHCYLDELLVDELRAIGYKKATDFFESVEKWYA